MVRYDGNDSGNINGDNDDDGYAMSNGADTDNDNLRMDGYRNDRPLHYG